MKIKTIIDKICQQAQWQGWEEKFERKEAETFGERKTGFRLRTLTIELFFVCLIFTIEYLVYLWNFHQ